MRRRILVPACLLTACAAFSAAGCDTLKPSTRKHAEAVKADEVEAVGGSAEKVLGLDADPKKPAPFFKNSRKTGGLSDEARDIEASLGVR
ncbi:hypothetical protein [Paludisphaera mucosa]|uniref:Uncharacterized protein n=1 Tax=Paludisphaera mucosa TaxID=3030827 RepID=A0ABT6FD29_9BACT|nr:hypothetical protein [Paludisphaera mucosa]MDG3005293.1 hypothetical protein [Paludisphaera mucosa]